MAGGFFDRVIPKPDELKPGTIRPYYHQLVVIGNGFDLECGLASKYEDFFVPRHEAIQTQNWRETGKLEGLGYDATPTAWDFLLASQCYAPWYCVEDAIRDLILPTKEAGRSSVELGAVFMDRLNNPSAPRYATLENDEEDKVIAEVIDYINHDRDTDRPTNGQQWTFQDYTEFLGNQLHKLEENFSAYLNPISENDKGYINRAYTLMKQILLEDLPESGFYEYGATLLSFNYTNPFKKKVGKVDNVKLMNVHGNLDGGIIFGIDGSKCLENPLAFPFSKTYRVITSGMDFGEGTVHMGGDGKRDRATSVIKFYGHSLGEADYSYFQAIFDGVNLYSSDTQVIFYYRPWMGSDGKRVPENLARNDIAAKVTKLMTVYGKTLDNEDHGRNLMHKLMIEGRLQVKLLEGYDN